MAKSLPQTGVKGMKRVRSLIVQAVCSVALYCRQCGKLHLHDVPYFRGREKYILRCSCGWEQGALLQLPGEEISLELSCAVCCHQTRRTYRLRTLRRLAVEQIYCEDDFFEIGYIGQRARLEALLKAQEKELEKFFGGRLANSLYQQRFLLRAMNVIHDLASVQGIRCSCGSLATQVDIRGHLVCLECCSCGRYQNIPVESEQDLIWLLCQNEIVLMSQPRRRKKR